MHAGYPWEASVINIFLTYFGGVMSTIWHPLKVLAFSIGRDYNKPITEIEDPFFFLIHFTILRRIHQGTICK
jgi:hypothetical protein